jgi:F0F1-type ATP synthase assembly protein I
MAKISEEGALWSIFGYLISGLLIWGGIGYFLDKWLLHARHHYFALGGLVLGAGASIYLVWLRYGRD